MPSPRFHPLLVAGAACLALAACGSDDDPPQANAPAQTAPTQTAPAQTPPAQTTATDAAAAGDGRSGDPADAAADPDASPDATTTSTDARSTDRSSRPSSKDSAGSGEKPTTNGDTASAATETVKIRESLVALQEAFAAKDGKKACSLIIGIPKKADPKNPGLSCESLGQGTARPLSEENRKAAAGARVTVDGDVAVAELAPGVPFTLRKIDGRWRVDYSKMARPGASQG